MHGPVDDDEEEWSFSSTITERMARFGLEGQQSSTEAKKADMEKDRCDHISLTRHLSLEVRLIPSATDLPSVHALSHAMRLDWGDPTTNYIRSFTPCAGNPPSLPTFAKMPFTGLVLCENLNLGNLS